MTTATETCWADPLSRAERRILSEKLARACKRSWDAAHTAPDGRRATIRQVFLDLAFTSAEMSDLHLDVTERAQVAS